jgi:hypothetical protein
MLKRKLLWVLVVLLPSYSYSESIVPYSGQTGNAAANAHTWNMDNVLPSGVPGLDINAVIYRYTINKPTDEQVDVHVQNKNANGTGYIFRETDSWMPGSLSGTGINKAVPVVPSNRSLWGDGSIEVEGNGSVSDANVIYNYRVDPCFDPQFNPNCPGYKVPVPDIPVVSYDIYDATADMQTKEVCKEGDTSGECQNRSEDEEMSDEEKEEKEAEEKKDRKERLEKALAAADNSMLFANALAQSQILDAMNNAIQMNGYYTKSINGGVYNETVQLVDKQLPENRNGLRNGLAQQILHDKMVDMQYGK